jgi:hypothetical protein
VRGKSVGAGWSRIQQHGSITRPIPTRFSLGSQRLRFRQSPVSRCRTQLTSVRGDAVRILGTGEFWHNSWTFRVRKMKSTGNQKGIFTLEFCSTRLIIAVPMADGNSRKVFLVVAGGNLAAEKLKTWRRFTTARTLSYGERFPGPMNESRWRGVSVVV